MKSTPDPIGALALDDGLAVRPPKDSIPANSALRDFRPLWPCALLSKPDFVGNSSRLHLTPVRRTLG